MFHLIDTRSLLLFMMLVMFSRALVMVYVWYVEKEYPAVKYWAMGSILIALSTLFLSLRDLVPHLVSIILANALLIIGWLFTDVGMVVSAERRPPWIAAITITIIGFLAIAWFEIIDSDFGMRSMILTLATLAFDIYAMGVCLQFKGKGRAITLRILAGALLVLGISNLWKGMGNLQNVGGSLLQTSLHQGQFLIVSLVFTLVTTVLFVVLVFQKQQENLDHEIEERKKREEDLKLAALVYENSGEGMMVTDAQSRIIMVNAAFEQHTGYSFQDVVGKTPRILQAGCESPAFYQTMWAELLRSGKWRGEVRNRTKAGEIRVEGLTINTVYDSNGKPLYRVALYHDITEQKNTAELVYQHANYDRLTSLPNRHYFFEQLSRELPRSRRENKRVALLFMDLNRFKPVNDKHGHEAGDFVLRTVAERWQRSLRGSDVLARLGGDEFAVIIGGVSKPEEAQAIAVKLLQALEAEIILPQGQACSVGTSIGIALYPDNAMEMDTLLRLADEAMYKCKQAAGKQYAFSDVVAGDTSIHQEWLALESKDLIGVSLLDEQHTELVRLVNNLNRLTKQDNKTEEIKALFVELVAYAEMHFDTEHELMRQYEYPDTAGHDKQHDELLRELNLMVSLFEAGDELRLLQFIKDWIFVHIQMSDKRLAMYLNTKNVH
jgi:diguanylate cyclase (GGDEF)-like protein/hemerythrin-like metal-binding protein/PAS domain S-box-containing protein